jgi:hypothetical protein
MVVASLSGAAAGVAAILLWRAHALTSGYRAFFATLTALAIAHVMALVGRAHRGRALQLASLAITTAIVALGNYFVVNALVQQAAVRHGEHVPSLVGPELFARAWHQLMYPVDPIFFVAALVVAVLAPRRRAAKAAA